jgi:hypothetical protein
MMSVYTPTIGDVVRIKFKPEDTAKTFDIVDYEPATHTVVLKTRTTAAGYLTINLKENRPFLFARDKRIRKRHKAKNAKALV